MTSRDIPLTDCKKGYTYAINSRNLGFGVYDGDQGFVGIREKFYNFYLFTEYHYDQGPPFGTVRPFKELEACPIEDLRCNLETICLDCREPVEFREHPPGTDLEGRGSWWHKSGEALCDDAHPGAPLNKVLFDYLTDVEARHDWRQLKVESGQWTQQEADESKADQERWESEHPDKVEIMRENRERVNAKGWPE